ncbi:MAG: methyltransferase [Gemmatimonadota bacterium]
MAGMERLREYRRGAEWALAAATAVELGLVDALGGGPRPIPELAGELGVSVRGVRMLVGALEALGAVREDEDGIRLTGAARARLLDRSAPDYERDSLLQWLAGIRRWATDLPRAVTEGTPAEEGGPAAGAPDEASLERFMAAMDNKDPALVRAVVDTCLAVVPGAESALDVGGGPGTFTRAFAARGLQCALFDRPEILSHVGPKYGLDANPSVRLLAGDFLSDTPEGEYDIVLLANIAHIYAPDENRGLVRRLAGTLRPGGALALLDFVRGEGDGFAALFAITMLLHTQTGDTYDLSALESWLRAADLGRIRCHPLPGDARLVTGVR